MTASYYNSLTFTEVSGLSHRGGVLVLRLNEAEFVLISYQEDNTLLLPEIDKLIRNKTKIEEVLKSANQIILKKHFGFS